MLRNDIEKYIMLFLKIVFYIICIILGFLFVRVSFAYFSPFIAALVISIIIEPIVRLFQKLKLGRGLSTIAAMILSLGSFIAISVFAAARLISESRKLYTSLPNIYEYLFNWATHYVQKITDFYLQLTPEATKIVEDLLSSSFEKMKIFLGQILSRTPQSTINFITSLSGTLIFFIIAMISTFFITKDKELIANFLLKQLPPSWQNKLVVLKKDLFHALIGFLKAQIIILSITCLESYIGLSIIGVEYAFLIALGIALVDILPILGTGGIYVPWALISFINKDYRLGISLLVLYGVIVVVRYIIEPKIVGTQLGIHPVVALMSMFAGLKLLGVIGIILGPTLVVAIKACQHAGIIPKFKQ